MGKHTNACQYWYTDTPFYGNHGNPCIDVIFSQDAEAHGNSKLISAYIAMLERNEIAPARGEYLLRYVAATPDAAPYVLGKALFNDMRGIRYDLAF